MKNNGIFVISLDFELYWGVRDKKTIEQYKDNLLGTLSAIDRILDLFEKYNIHATWATVGFLMAKDKIELEKYIPIVKPNYINKNLSPYEYLSTNLDNKFHFAQACVKKIINTRNQEIATHTFSHYYCMEEGQSLNEFKHDLEASKEILIGQFGLKTKSIVFPRNQFNKEYLNLLKDLEILTYRGNENSWIYKSSSNEESTNILKRALRLIDHYINITGHKTYSLDMSKQIPLNIPSSRFLRPYNKKIKIFESIRLRRIKNAMLYAAQNNEVFHLWWHPHNFGINKNENCRFLEKILEYYRYLESKYEMKSLTMLEVFESIKGNK